VQTDISSYYVLGYYSANPAQDGKYRHVTVKVASLPESAKIDYRKGYYAAKVWGKMNSSDKERQLEDALTLDDPFTDLPLAMEVIISKLDVTNISSRSPCASPVHRSIFRRSQPPIWILSAKSVTCTESSWEAFATRSSL